MDFVPTAVAVAQEGGSATRTGGSVKACSRSLAAVAAAAFDAEVTAFAAWHSEC